MILGWELELASLCISSRLSCPATSNESLPISTPISATALLSLCDMACSLTLAPPGQLRLLRGWRTAGPSNSAHKETRSSALPQSRSESDMLSFWAESESAGDSPALSNALQPLMSVCCRRCKTRTLGQQKNVSLTAPHQTLREAQKPTTTVSMKNIQYSIAAATAARSIRRTCLHFDYQYSGSSWEPSGSPK